MPGDVLDLRSLNRATLSRQLLLERSPIGVVDAVAHVVGLQAQVPTNPYLGLWSRLDGFQPEHLGRILVDRQLVRIAAMRSTIHLLTADDCLVLRPLAQPVLDRELERHRDHAPSLAGLDLEPALAFARQLVAEQPRSGRELRTAFAERFPDLDPAALTFACRNRLAFVQVPPRGVWGQSGEVRSTTAEAWLGRPVAVAPSVDDVLLRYLAAFGPATAADVSTWSGLTGMAEVLGRLRPQLRAFRDESGRELLDLPDAPRPDPATPAPTRFLPEYDNVLLSHADRRRVVADDDRKRIVYAPGSAHGTVLHDGFVRATWRIDAASLVLAHIGPLPSAARAAIETEAVAALPLLAPGADAAVHDIRFEPAA